jgi:hypothetical protein
MPVDFPNSPNVNDQFTVNGKTFNFNGVSWDSVFSPSAGVLNNLADVSVPSPVDEYVLTWDSASSQWIAAEPTGGVGSSSTPHPFAFLG